jgi:hypothetical protein
MQSAEQQPLPNFAAMGFTPGKVHLIAPDRELDITALIEMMRPGHSRVIRLATATNSVDAHKLVTVEVWISRLTAVLRSGTEFEIDGTSRVTETQWRDIDGVRLVGEITGYHNGIVTSVPLLAAPRSITGYLVIRPDEIAETPKDEHLPKAETVWLQFRGYRPPAGGEIIVTPLLDELEA